jgi:hypothetical protein
MLAAFLALTSAGCESLLEVDLPGAVTADALNDPDLAETLVNSVQGDFECGFVDYMRYPGQWFEEWTNTSQSRPDALVGLRSQLVQVYADPCDSGTGPLWSTIQLPRQQAVRAISLITGFNPADVQNLDFLIAKARMYEGYSIQLLGEQFCGVTFDGGPEVSREAAYDSAVVKFTDAIARASASITAGEEVTAATAVRNAAYVGRARAKLLRGNDPGGVVADATAVSAGFQYLSTYDSNPGRRRNRLFETNNADDAMMPHRDYTALTIDPVTGLTFDLTTGDHLSGTGTADPRVVVQIGPEDEPRGFTQYRRQRKYWASSNSGGYAVDIPFSTWREALLMIAEADPAQALAIINQLRTSTQGLPAGVSAAAFPLPTISAATWTGLSAAQQVQAVREERRRELWLQGTQAGDKIRWAYPAWDVQDEFGQQTPVPPELAGGGCMPIPLVERNANPPI